MVIMMHTHIGHHKPVSHAAHRLQRLSDANVHEQLLAEDDHAAFHPDLRPLPRRRRKRLKQAAVGREHEDAPTGLLAPGSTGKVAGHLHKVQPIVHDPEVLGLAPFTVYPTQERATVREDEDASHADIPVRSKR